MKRMTRVFLLLSLLVASTLIVVAQQAASINSLEEEIQRLEASDRDGTLSDEVKQLNRQFLNKRRSQLSELIRLRIESLRSYQIQNRSILKENENETINKSLNDLEQKLSILDKEKSNAQSVVQSPTEQSVTYAEVMVTSSLPLTAGSPNKDAALSTLTTQGATPTLGLSHPASGRTALPTGEFKLSWALRPFGLASTGIRYIVEVSETNTFSAATDTIREEVPDATFFTIPREALLPGKRYFWQVTAICPTTVQCPNGTLTAVNAPFEFTTALEPFRRLEAKGFTLQRAVAGDDATEGASFSFQRTFREKNVYATDFALIWDKPRPVNVGNGRTQIFPELSMEGHLSSDRSASEDVWRFGATAGIFTSFNRSRVDENGKLRFGRLKGLTSYLGGKFEADRDFDTKKIYFEALETPTFVKVFMGQYSGNPDSSIQFRWRPYLAFNAGRTMKRGDAVLPEDTILRIVPRLRTEFKLNFISIPLGLKRTLLFADDTFYYLPLENGSKTPNFAVAGLEFDLSSDVGLAFIYKNGKAAPKFERVHTLGAAFTVRFGAKSDQ